MIKKKKKKITIKRRIIKKKVTEDVDGQNQTFLLRVFNHPSKLSKGDKSGSVLTAAGAAALRLMSRSSKVVPRKSADQASVTPGHREEAGTEVRPD